MERMTYDVFINETLFAGALGRHGASRSDNQGAKTMYVAFRCVSPWPILEMMRGLKAQLLS